MRRTIITILFVLGLAVRAQAGHAVVRVEDVILLAEEGLTVETIIAFLDTRDIGFDLGSAEIRRLTDAGVSDDVIRYLIERSGTAAASPPRTYVALTAPGYYGFGASILPYWWYGHHHQHHIDSIHALGWSDHSMGHHGFDHGLAHDVGHGVLDHHGVGDHHVGSLGHAIPHATGHAVMGGHTTHHGDGHGGGHAGGHSGH